MNKHDVMKALALCSNANVVSCEECPYYGIAECDARMTHDAIALLQSNDTKPTYHTAIIYTKHTNLMPWYNGRCDAPRNPTAREYYSKDREVQLILLVRHEDGKCICRIKCPINPLPIKGEFQCVSTGEMSKLLKSMGWTYKEKVHSGMFR